MRAELFLQRRLGEKAIGHLPAAESARVRYEDLRNTLILDYEINGHRSLTRGPDGKPYLTSVKHMDKYFAGWRVNAITVDAIRQYVLSRQKAGASNATINRSLAALKRMFHRAIQDGRIHAMPHIEMLKEAPARRGFVEYGEFQKLRDNLPAHLQPVVTLAFYTGMRLGEIRKLRWEQIGDGVIRLSETKNDEPRTVPLNAEVKRLLPRKGAGEYVFGGASPLGQFRKSWWRACIKAGLGKLDERGLYDGLIFHDLRRTGVRNLVRAGVSEDVAMKISGHKTRSVFSRYNITSERDLMDAAAKLDRYIAQEARNGESTVKVKAKRIRK
jgi:integrase